MLDAVGNLEVDLRPGQGTVDTGCRLRRVAAHEVWKQNMSAQLPVRSRGTLTVLVKQQDIATGEIDGVSSAQAGHWELWSDASDYDLWRRRNYLRPAPTTMTLSGMVEDVEKAKEVKEAEEMDANGS